MVCGSWWNDFPQTSKMPSWIPFRKAPRSSASSLTEKHSEVLPTSTRCEGRSDDHALVLNPDKPGRSAFSKWKVYREETIL